MALTYIYSFENVDYLIQCVSHLHILPAHTLPTCIHTHAYTHMYTHTHAHMYTHTYAHTHVRTHMYTHTCTLYVCGCTHAHSCAHTPVFKAATISSPKAFILALPSSPLLMNISQAFLNTSSVHFFKDK